MIHEPSFLKRGNKLQSIHMRHVKTRLDSHGVASRANRLPAWRIGNRGDDLCRFDRIESNRQHFQPTLHSPPKVMIREIMIHEPSSFLKCCHKHQSIRTIRVDPSSRIDNILCPGALYFPILAQIDFRHFESTAIRVDLGLESTPFSTHPQSPDQL